MLQVSDSKLHHVRQQIIRQQPLPEEFSVQLDETRLKELLRLIESVHDGDDFDLLVARLPRRQLNDLFGLLLVIDPSTTDTAAATSVVERINLILERRATLSLAQTGWAFYQQHFYNAELAAAMKRLCTALTQKGETELFISLCHRFGCTENLPQQIAALWVEDQNKPVNVLKNDWNLAGKLKELYVLAGNRFSTVLLLEFFNLCPPTRTAAESDLFGNCLDLAVLEEKAQLLIAIYSEYRLEQKYLPLNQVVLQQLGMPPTASDKSGQNQGASSYRAEKINPVWSLVPDHVRQHFRQWALINLIGQHTVGQDRKRAFYQSFLMQLKDCCLLDPAVLLLEFPGFYILDHQDYSHQVMYYDRPTLELALEGQQNPAELAAPFGTVTTAREIMLSQNKSNRVLLRLEEVNLLYARDFINSILNPERRDTLI